VADVEDEQRLGDDLHPRADRRAHEPEPKQSKVPMSQDSERPTAPVGHWNQDDGSSGSRTSD
jgi:hypothetical protein